MRTVCTYDEQASQQFNIMSVSELKEAKEKECFEFEIHNGKITGATQRPRDYVWLTDKRNNFIPKA